jgi:hypothetical protein
MRCRHSLGRAEGQYPVLVEWQVADSTPRQASEVTVAVREAIRQGIVHKHFALKGAAIVTDHAPADEGLVDVPLAEDVKTGNGNGASVNGSKPIHAGLDTSE